MTLRGSCHCGNLSLALETRRPPEELPVRACQCSFCRRHAGLSTSDPDGEARIAAREPGETSLYRFGMKSADFVICRRCGVYVAAVMREGDRTWAVLNLNALDDRARFTAAPQPMDYEGEDLAGRMARRKARWTPATFTMG
jgi:hypothetical protein